MLECTSEYKDNMHLLGRTLTYDWSANSFYNGCLSETFFKVQSEFSVQNIAKTLSHRQPL